MVDCDDTRNDRWLQKQAGGGGVTYVSAGGLHGRKLSKSTTNTVAADVVVATAAAAV